MQRIRHPTKVTRHEQGFQTDNRSTLSVLSRRSRDPKMHITFAIVQPSCSTAAIPEEHWIPRLSQRPQRTQRYPRALYIPLCGAILPCFFSAFLTKKARTVPDLRAIAVAMGIAPLSIPPTASTLPTALT